MTMINDVAALIEPIKGIDQVATLNFNDEQAADKKLTYALVTEVLADVPTEHGSNRTASFNDTVAISIFYGQSKSESSPTVEQAIFDALESAGWYQTYTSGHTLDPSSNQFSITKQFTHEKER